MALLPSGVVSIKQSTPSLVSVSMVQPMSFSDSTPLIMATEHKMMWHTVYGRGFPDIVNTYIINLTPICRFPQTITVDIVLYPASTDTSTEIPLFKRAAQQQCFPSSQALPPLWCPQGCRNQQRVQYHFNSPNKLLFMAVLGHGRSVV